MEKKRVERLRKNTVSSLTFRILSIIFGLLLPRIYLLYYGSEINGMVNSITQFLGFIAMLELGVGAVVESALYKPLADNDNHSISCIVKSAKRFYKIIAKVLIVYVIALIFILPRLKSFNGDFLTSTLLIFAISISSFANYYFGIVNVLLLNADQKGYLQYNLQIITLLINTGVTVTLVTHGVSISIVKILSSCIFLIRPVYLYFYVKKFYEIEQNIKIEKEPLTQKWNGVAQHVANIVLENTDVIVLTLFSSLSYVSIYSIYSLIVSSIERVFSALTSGVLALWGELWAKKETTLLVKQFEFTEWAIHNMVVFLYGCSLVLMPSFVKLYTVGVNDANYVQPIFSGVLCIAYLVRCLQRPYSTLLFATNTFKKTQSGYFITAFVNIVISIFCVRHFGLVGVAFGTFVALTYQLIWMSWFVYKKLLVLSITHFFKLCFSDLCSIILALLFSYKFGTTATSYVSWFINAILTVIIWGCVLLLVNGIMFRKHVYYIVNRVKCKVT